MNNSKTDKVAKAINLFHGGYNCSQSVLVAFEDELAVNKENLLKIASGFGGGMGRLQQTCGAVTGAYMVISLVHGQELADDSESRENTYKKIRDFNQEFVIQRGSESCEKLLNCSLTTHDGQKTFKENNLKETICNKCIESAVNIATKLL